MRKEIYYIIENLQGTCGTLDDAVSGAFEDENMDSFSLTKEEMEYLDSEIFLCEDCGWWFEVCDKSESHEETCIECNEE